MIITPCLKRPVLEPCTLPEMHYQVDPNVGCEHYCYYCYVLDQAETDWRKEVLTHADIAARLESAEQPILRELVDVTAIDSNVSPFVFRDWTQTQY